VLLNFLAFLWGFLKYYPKRQERLTLHKHLSSLPVIAGFYIYMPDEMFHDWKSIRIKEEEAYYKFNTC
jgi:hypothetical protein